MNTNPKALFMAQYLGQRVFRYDNHIEHTYELCGGHIQDFTNGIINDCFLELRSVSDLTDEEAIQLAKLAYGRWDNLNNKIAIVPNADNIHEDILSVEILRFINHPSAAKWYKDCHIQIDRVDPDINKYGFRNDGQETCDELIDSACQWAVQDYLRAIGILIPFTFISDGRPITLSTEEIIKRGWVRLVKSTDNGQ